MESKIVKLKSLVVGPFASNCYIVGSESGEGIVIDPGDDADRIVGAIEELNLDIKLIVATHGHIDHIGAVREVKEATGAQFAIHGGDVGDLSGRRNPFSFLMAASVLSPPKPERLLKDGDILKAGNLSFTVLHTPGHSPGGICLLEHGVVFVGDTLFCQSIGRFDFPGASGSQLLNSIHSKLLTLPDDTVVYPGHGPSTTIGDERCRNPFLRPGITF
jgi:glyoxylase-like metal-dependent hydrolase (beta-lactamase superfamily II)